MIYLYTTYYNEKKPERKQELVACIQKNLCNNAIDKVFVLNEGEDLSELSEKLVNIPVTKRPSYQDFITQINQNDDPDTFHMIANTDIFFEENIGVLEFLPFENTCLALSRYDTTESDKPLLYNHNDSQDVWIFKGPVKSTLKATHPLGVPRCDNRFMYDLELAGYNVKNPAFSIKAYHMHKGQRAVIYTDVDNRFNIQPPFRYMFPHNQFGALKTIIFNVGHPYKLGPYKYDIKKLNNWWLMKLWRIIHKAIVGKYPQLIGYENEYAD